jgi:hypothetical protein
VQVIIPELGFGGVVLRLLEILVTLPKRSWALGPAVCGLAVPGLVDVVFSTSDTVLQKEA